jgi:secondary thiamine-phosphate synthase enzyme
VQTAGRSIIDISSELRDAVARSRVLHGVVHLFVHHTSASLIVSENADPDVLTDLETYLSQLVPDGDPRYLHTDEGPDDMPSHVRSALTLTSLAVPVSNGRVDLGTWQAVYLWEHRHAPHRRRVSFTVQGSA